MRPRCENREMIRSEIVTLSVTPSEKRELVKISLEEKKSWSQIMRELLKEKINTIKLK